MKEAFMVHIVLPDVFSDSFNVELNEQRSLMKDLMDKRIVLSCSLDMERKNLWVFMEGASQKQVMDVISKFPIIKSVSIDIHELAYHDIAPLQLPDLILN